MKFYTPTFKNPTPAILFFFIFSFQICAQASPIILTEQEFDINIDPYLEFYIDDSYQQDPEDVINANFVPFETAKKENNLFNAKGYYWLKLTIKNTINQYIETELTQWSLDQPCVRLYEINRTTDGKTTFSRIKERMDDIHSTYFEFRRIFRFNLNPNSNKEILITNHIEEPSTCNEARYFSFNIRSLSMTYKTIAMDAWESGFAIGFLILPIIFLTKLFLNKIIKTRQLACQLILLASILLLMARYEGVYSPSDRYIYPFVHSGVLMVLFFYFFSLAYQCAQHSIKNHPFYWVVICNGLLIFSVGLNCDWIGSTASSDALFYSLDYIVESFFLLSTLLASMHLHRLQNDPLAQSTRILILIVFTIECFTSILIEIPLTPSIIIDNLQKYLTAILFGCYSILLARACSNEHQIRI